VRRETRPSGGAPDPERRALLTRVTAAAGGAALCGAAVPFVSSMWPSARAIAAGAPVHFDVGGLGEGELATTSWRKKPVWIMRRTQAQLKRLADERLDLRDPRSQTPQQPEQMKLHLADGVRAVNPEYLVLVGICTHLGCIPEFRKAGSMGAEWPGGFYCPCHGSKYDLSGRVLSGSPAPLNLPVPPYYFKTASVITIGELRDGGDLNWHPAIW